jgi:hypothetical protein
MVGNPIGIAESNQAPLMRDHDLAGAAGGLKAMPVALRGPVADSSPRNFSRVGGFIRPIPRKRSRAQCANSAERQRQRQCLYAAREGLARASARRRLDYFFELMATVRMSFLLGGERFH